MFTRVGGENSTPRLTRDCGGAAMIEFALVAPILFSLVLGTIEFGQYLQQHHTLVKGARDATRYLSRIEMNCAGTTDFCCPSTAASWGNAETNARNLAMRGSLDPAASPVLKTWTDPATISFTVACLDNTSSAYRGQAEIPIITTSIVVPYTQIGFLSFFGVGSLDVKSSHQEVNFGE